MQSKLQIHRDKELPRQNLLLTALGNGIIDRFTGNIDHFLLKKETWNVVLFYSRAHGKYKKFVLSTMG